MKSKSYTLPDADYELVNGAAWFGVKGFSIRIRNTEVGVVVDIYERNKEAVTPMASCFALDADLEVQTEEVEVRNIEVGNKVDLSSYQYLNGCRTADFLYGIVESVDVSETVVEITYQGIDTIGYLPETRLLVVKGE